MANPWTTSVAIVVMEEMMAGAALTRPQRIGLAILLGVAMTAFGYVFFALPIPGATIVQLILTLASPIYTLRFVTCHSEHGGTELLDAITPLFTYGAIVGYFVPFPSKLGLRFFAMMAASFVGVVVFVLLLAEIFSRADRCHCPGFNCYG